MVNFRKSKKFGPVRITASKGGLSTSIGGKGMRVSKSTSGRTTTTVGIPGTGIYHQKSTTARKGAKPAPATSSAGVRIGKRILFTLAGLLGALLLVAILVAIFGG